MVEVDHADKVTQFFASFWKCEGLNCLDFIRYGQNSVTSDVITQIVKFVYTEAKFAGVDLEPRLLKAGEHLFEDRKMLCPRSFCNMQKVINVNTHCVYTDEEFRHLLLEDVMTVAQTYGELLILVLAPLGVSCAEFF